MFGYGVTPLSDVLRICVAVLRDVTVLEYVWPHASRSLTGASGGRVDPKVHRRKASESPVHSYPPFLAMSGISPLDSTVGAASAGRGAFWQRSSDRPAAHGRTLGFNPNLLNVARRAWSAAMLF